MVVVGVGLGAFVPAWPCSWCFALCLLCLLYARSGCEDVRFWGETMLLRDGCNIPRCHVPGKTFDKGPATILPSDDERVPYLHFDLMRVCAGPKGVVLGFIHFDEPRLGHERCCEPPLLSRRSVGRSKWRLSSSAQLREDATPFPRANAHWSLCPV